MPGVPRQLTESEISAIWFHEGLEGPVVSGTGLGALGVCGSRVCDSLGQAGFAL